MLKRSLIAALLLVSGWYFPKAEYLASTAPSSAPLIAISIGWIVAMIIILAVYHGVIALWGYDTDERDRLIELKAERNVGVLSDIYYDHSQLFIVRADICRYSQAGIVTRCLDALEHGVGLCLGVAAVANRNILPGWSHHFFLNFMSDMTHETVL